MTEDQYSAYRAAKSTRPSWANALIVAACIFIAAIVYTLMSGLSVSWWMFVGAGIALLVAGIYALVGVTRRAP